MKRRNFLFSTAALGISYYPIKKLLNAILESENFKDSTTLSIGPTKNYIQIHMYGGPTRWSFDHYLNPYSSDLFYKHPMIFNEFDKNKSIHSQPFNFIKRNGINSSSLLQNMIPTTSGRDVEMSQIFKNSFTIRGVHMEGTTGHPMNSSKVLAPKIGGHSLDGLIGDRSSKPISCVSIGSSPVNRAFKSDLCSVAKVPTNEKNYLEYLLSPFNLPGKAVFNSKEIEPYLDEAISSLKKSNKHAAYKRDLFKAKKFFKDSILNLLDQYDHIVNKYESLINESLKRELINISDQVVPSPKFPFSLDGDISTNIALGPYVIYDNYLLNNDLRTFFTDVKVNSMAKEFALSEFIFTNGISSSIVISTEDEIGNFFEGQNSKALYSKDSIQRIYEKSLNRTTFKSVKAPKNEKPVLSLDSHDTGSLVNMLTCSKYYHCLSTCINELISTLKSTKVESSNLFNETVIHLTSEFDRAPRLSCDGSDHNEQAHVSTIFNGNIENQFIIGNIFSGSKSNKEELGTWGNSAPVESLNGSRVGISNVSSTLSEMIGVPKIVKRSKSLIEHKNGKIVSKIEKAKNIEGTYEDYIS